MENSKPQENSSFRHRQLKVRGGEIHVVEGGAADGSAVLFVHGYPQDWRAFEKVMRLASAKAHVFSLDLPGIGGSKFAHPPTGTQGIAATVHEAVQALGLQDYTLVGHDLGGMVTFPYLTEYGAELSRAVIMDVVIPGIEPWDKVVNNPYIWHFRFHAIPELPEKLVQGHQADYFAYYFNTISAHPEAIDEPDRLAYAAAYADPVALKTGFDWYRGFTQDAKVNGEFAATDRTIETPLLYLRGEKEGGDINMYIEGFKKAGVLKVQPGMIPDSGHYAPEEQPEEVWKQIAAFIGLA